MRKKLIVANWKMFLNTHQASLFLHKLAGKIEVKKGVEMVLCPSVLSLQSLSLQVDHRQFKLGAQNCYWRDEGPYTGEVSATMLRGVVQYVIVGHSERRHTFGENDKDIRNKVQAVIRNQMKPILCVGETAQERADKETKHVIHDQLTSGLANVTSEEVTDITIAYEPLWAIGTGHSSTPSHIADIEKIVRSFVEVNYGKAASEAVRFLYGGSVTSDNAANFLAIPGVDGLLIGGASLQAESFAAIVAVAGSQVNEDKKELMRGEK